MKTIECGVELNFPVREVYNQWTQFESYPAFMSGITEVQQLDDNNLYWVVKVAGVERGFQARIVEQIPDQRIAWESTSGPKNSGIVVFDVLEPGRTQVRVHLTWDPKGLVEKLGAAVRFDDAEVQSSLNEFKRLMIENGFATGAWRGKIESEHATLNIDLDIDSQESQHPEVSNLGSGADKLPSNAQELLDRTIRTLGNEAIDDKR